MTVRPAALVLASVLLIVPAASQGQSRGEPPPAADPMVQQIMERQLAVAPLDSSRTIASLELTGTPFRDIVETVAKAFGITVRYHSAVPSLDMPSAVKLSSAKVEDALRTVLDPKALSFKVLGARSIFIYPNTPENSAKYTDSRKTFTIVKADLNLLVTTLNQALTQFGTDELRPVIVSDRASRTIIVRATPEVMARVSKVIADNDK